MVQHPSRIALFFAELKRRRVVQVGLLYLGTSVVVIEAADLIFPVLGIPDFYYDVVVVLALVGFPVALILAWLYDLTPGGVARTGEMTDEELAAVRPGRTRFTMFAAMATVGVAIAVSWYAIERIGSSRAARIADEEAGAPAQRSGQRIPGTRPDVPVVAVLPFDDFSDEGAGEAFARGMHEELLARLGQSQEIALISRTSVQRWRDSELDLGQIADSLGADLVIEGSVIRTPQQVRVTVQVIDGETDVHLWSESFRQELDDIITVQANLADTIVSGLMAARGSGPGSARPTAPPGSRGSRVGTRDPVARDRFIEAMTLRASGSPDRFDRIIPLLEEAVAADSSFARGWAALADALLRKSLRAGSDRTDLSTRALAASRRALLLDPENALARTTTAVLQHRVLRDLGLAEQEFLAALESDPDDPFTQVWYAFVLLETGRPGEAAEYARSALRYARGDLEFQLMSGEILFLAREYDEAESILRDAVARNPGILDAYSALEEVAVARGDLDEAMAMRLEQIIRRPVDTGRSEELERFRALRQTGPEGYWRFRLEGIESARADGDPWYKGELAQVYMGLGDPDSALEVLESWSPSDQGMVLLGSHPAWDPLRDDPRFEALLAR
jgi:TolB-like protein/tetratricopeptide (TPR) repeat protein